MGNTYPCNKCSAGCGCSKGDNLSNILLVLRHEFTTTIQRQSFVFASIGMPLVALLLFGILPAIGSKSAAAAENSSESSVMVENRKEGFVDASGLVKKLPGSMPPEALLRYPDEASALQALQSSQIDVYYLIPADYLKSGSIIAVWRDFNPIAAFGRTQTIQQALQFNLLNGDDRLVAQINNPLKLQTTLLEADARYDPDNPLTFFLPYTATLLFYIAILTSASLLLSSVNKDRENRMLEVLLVSSKPHELLAGKILGLGAAGLIQTAIWLGAAFILVRLRGQDISFLREHPITLELLVAGLLFFTLGYALYASLMASIGALVPNMREASQLSFFLVVPMLLPLLLINLIIREPNGSVAIILSLFPLTSPVTMIARLVSASVPIWQMVFSAALLVGSTYLVLRAVARVFRAQVLLSGQSFSLKRFWRVLSQPE